MNESGNHWIKTKLYNLSCCHCQNLPSICDPNAKNHCHNRIASPTIFSVVLSCTIFSYSVLFHLVETSMRDCAFWLWSTLGKSDIFEILNNPHVLAMVFDAWKSPPWGTIATYELWAKLRDANLTVLFLQCLVQFNCSCIKQHASRRNRDLQRNKICI